MLYVSFVGLYHKFSRAIRTGITDLLFAVCQKVRSMTLEQTINADAASGSSGISVLTNSVDGRTRWMKSRSIRTRVISNILDYLELNQKENVSKESNSYEIHSSRREKSCLTSPREKLFRKRFHLFF